MALIVDIQQNDAFEKSALRAASALEETASWEAKVDAVAEKIGNSYRQAAEASKDLKAYTADAAKQGAAGAAHLANVSNAGTKDTSKKLLDASKKESDAAKKKAADRKKNDEDSKRAIREFAGVVAGAAVAAAALGVAIALSAKNAFDAKREAAALIDAFTGKRGPEHLKLLDTLATNLGASFTDVRGKFVEFRQAGLDNKLSFKLIKMRADLMAVGLSAEAADKEISAVTGAADGRSNLGARRALDEISRAYRGIGSGAAAAAYSAVSFEGAQNKIKNVMGERLSDLWKKIGPDIGKAANALAEFAVKLIDSDEGKEVIAGIAAGFKAVASAVNSENLTTGLVVVQTAVATVADVFEFTGKAVAFAAVKIVEVVDWLGEKVSEGIDFLIDTFPSGAALVDGLIDGITSRASAAADAALDLAKNIAGSFADALGIHSPSKVFEAFGKDTVAGYEKGESAAVGSAASFPLTTAVVQSAKEPPAMVTASTASPVARSESSRESGARTVKGGDITIEQLIVQSNGDPEEIGRSVRAALQRFIQDGALSRGLA